jgi:hypothetical protein
MSDVAETKSLTRQDPVDPQTLQNLEALSNTKQELAIRLADLEVEKLNLLGTLRRVGMEFDQQIVKILTDRGIDPQTQVQINPKDGVITVEAE